MVLKSGVHRVGDKVFIVNRSKMSSSQLRRVEREFNQALGASRKAFQQKKALALEEIKQRKRELLKAEERREVKREQTLARRAQEGERISREQEQFLLDRAQTVSVPQRKQTGGGRSSTFEQAVKASRLSLPEREQFRVLRREEQKARRELEKAQRQVDLVGAETFPGFSGKRPSEILKTKKLLDPARAKKATSVADILRIGTTKPRLLPSLSQGGGGAVRLLHAVEKVQFGGAMEGILTPEAAGQVGLRRIQRRQAAKTLETPIGSRATRAAVKRVSEARAIAEPGEVAPPTSVYEVFDTKLGTTKTFKTRVAAEGFAARQFQADQTRVLRQKKALTPPPIPKDLPVETGFEVTTIKSTTATTTERLFPEARPLAVNLPIIGRVEEPFISPLLTRGVREAEQIITEQRAKGKGISDPETQKRLKDLTKISFEITRDDPISKPVLQRISQLDIPFVDIKPSVGASTAITAATLGAAGPLGILLPVAGGATVGRKTTQVTGSPLLGLAAAGLSAGAISKIQGGGIPRTSLKAVKSRIVPKKSFLDAKPGAGLKLTGKQFVKGEKLSLQVQGLGKQQRVRISPATSKQPTSDVLFDILVKRSKSKLPPAKISLVKPPITAKSMFSTTPTPGLKGFRLGDFMKGAKPGSIKNIRALSRLTSRKTGATDFLVRFGRRLGKKGQVTILKPPINKIAVGGARTFIKGAAPVVLAGSAAVTPGFAGGVLGFASSRPTKVDIGPVTVQRKPIVYQTPTRKPIKTTFKPISIVEPILQPIQRKIQIQPQIKIQPLPSPQPPVSSTRLIFPQPQKRIQEPVSGFMPLPPVIPFTVGVSQPPTRKPRKIPRLRAGSDFGFGEGFKSSGGFKTSSGLATGARVLDLGLGKRKKRKGRGNDLGRFLG